MKRLLAVALLFGLLLHGLSQSGAVSYLYRQRHTLAFQLGLLAERPIAICKSDYFQQTTWSQIHVDEQSIPTGVAPSPEIGLDIPSAVLLAPPLSMVTVAAPRTPCPLVEYQALPCGIFRPPLV